MPSRPTPDKPTWIVRSRPKAWPKPKPRAAGWPNTSACPTACCARRRDARAKRWEAVLAAVGYVDQRLEPRIYDATPGTLAALIDEHRDVDRLLLVGHNPGLEELAALMHSGQSGDHRGMPPGGVVVLALPMQSAIEPGIATLSAFWWP